MAIVQCEGCGKKYSDRMPDCPFCHMKVQADQPVTESPEDQPPGSNVPQKEKPTQNTPWQKYRWFILVLCLFGMVAAEIYSTSAMNRIEGRTTKNKKRSHDTVMAYIISQNFVKANLKAPATAEFPLKPEFTRQLSNNKYRIGSYVDSQNSFGALIRTRWWCDLSIDEAGDWHIEDLQFIKI